jgi:serine phosphatase RsbU (regulator of sigma subunit)
MVLVAALAVCAPGVALGKNDGSVPPPGQATKAIAAQPPGQAQQAAAQPPGRATKAVAAQPPGQAKKAASRKPPGQARKTARPQAPQPAATRPRGQVRQAARTSRPRARAAARTRAAPTRSTARATRRPAGRVATRVSAPAQLAATAPPKTRPPASHRVATRATPRAKPDGGSGPVRVVTRDVTRTVRDIAHVIPGWAKALIAALACLLAVAAALILIGALRSRRLRAQRERLAADVGALQAALLPVVPEQVGPLAVSVAYRPAEGLAAGGDFYDVFALEGGRIGILVGDVSGHGRESLRTATFTRHMVRAYLEAGLGARESLRVAGRVIEQHRTDDDFATLLAAIYDPGAGTLSYASAGHPPPIILGPAAHNPMVVASSPPLGVESGTGLRQTTIPLPAGSMVCLYTDGLFEARKGGRTLGRARLTRIVGELGPDETASDLVRRVEQESDLIRDDVAVCIVRVDSSVAAAGHVRVEELEVEPGHIDALYVRRFLSACGVAPAEIENVLADARSRAASDASVLLRVRLARDRSGVDVLAADASEPPAEVSQLSPRRATRG